MDKSKATNLTGHESWFRYWMPYCFVQVVCENKKHVYLSVNRIYKPLGMAARESVQYEDYIKRCMVFARNPHASDDVWTNADSLYMYNDNPASAAWTTLID